jgi:sugar transferase (PEP-CTERM/EpsH1 system associated)
MATRILHVLHGFGTGGVESGLRRLMATLDPSEFEHAVLTVLPTAPGQREAVPITSLARDGGKGFLVPDFYRAIKKLRPDIVHTRNWATIEAIPAARLARVSSIVHAEHGRNLAELHGEPLRRRIFRRIGYELADRVVTVSEEMRRYFATQTGFAAERIVLMKDGVDDEQFRPNDETRGRMRSRLGLDAETVLVGSVARLDPVKDFPTLFAASDRAVAAGLDLHVVLIGDGPERRALEQNAATLPHLRDRVTFLGNRSDVPEWLTAFDIFVLPSRFEGISVALLEAMALGLPAIASRVGGNGEVVDEGKTGLMFEAGDAAALTDALLQLGHDRDRRHAMGAKARERVRREFSYRANADRYVELYRSLGRRRRHG